MYYLTRVVIVGLLFWQGGDDMKVEGEADVLQNTVLRGFANTFFLKI